MYAISISHESILLTALYIVGSALLIALIPIVRSCLKNSGKDVRETLFDQSLGMIILGTPFWLLSFAKPLESFLILTYALWWIGFGIWTMYSGPKEVSKDPTDIHKFRARLLLAIQYSGVIPIAGIFWSPKNPPPHLRRLADTYDAMRTRMIDDGNIPPPLHD